MHILVPLLLALTCSKALACDPREWRSLPPEDSYTRFRAHSVDRASLREVAAEKLQTARGLLSTHEFVPLTPAQLGELVESSNRLSSAAGSYYLLRVLRYETTNSGYSVYQAPSGEVLAEFGHLGPAGGPPREALLIASLPRPPSRLYLACSGAL